MPRIKVGRLGAHLALLFFVALWTFPTVGLLISSVRDKDQLAVSGWWTALTDFDPAGAPPASAAPTDQVEEGGAFVIKGNLLGDGRRRSRSRASARPTPTSAPMPAGQRAADARRRRDHRAGQRRLRLDLADRSSPTPAGRASTTSSAVPPRFTLDNYVAVLSAQGLAQSFINSITVAIPATIIPILIAAFAAYALAWMRFPFRGLIVARGRRPARRAAADVADSAAQRSTTASPTSSAPRARAISASGWRTPRFGLPLAIYLLRNYMAGLPREIMELARIDGASHFKIFTGMVLPLSFPALASFAIFQFLWIWNDLLVALVFLGAQDDKVVLTGRLVNLLGTQGDNWELLTAGAFISIVVPLIVFFALQRYFVRGLLAGSVK